MGNIFEVVLRRLDWVVFVVDGLLVFLFLDGYVDHVVKPFLQFPSVLQFPNHFAIKVFVVFRYPLQYYLRTLFHQIMHLHKPLQLILLQHHQVIYLQCLRSLPLHLAPILMLHHPIVTYYLVLMLVGKIYPYPKTCLPLRLTVKYLYIVIFFILTLFES